MKKIKHISAALTLILATFFCRMQASWATETCARMSLDEKIGQLFMIAVRSNNTQNFVDDAGKDVEKIIKEYHIGGVICFRGNPEKQVALLNRLQTISTYPLLVGQDCEWGLSMRLENTTVFPKNMTLGAIFDEALVYDLGKEIGRQCRAVGVHINFAPVVDVNTNANNPIIGTRSFGADKEAVARKGILFAQGLQAGGVLACAKHFPGHGDVATDSHFDLPVIKHSREKLFAEELYPFKQLIDAGIPAIMTAHLHIPSLDPTPGISATLSQPIITELLQKELGFTGLIITDALVMKAIADRYGPGIAELEALRAGNDILLCPLDVAKACDNIKAALANHSITQQELDAHVLKILRAKQDLKLHQQRMVDEFHLMERLNTPYAKELSQKLYQEAITVVRNQEGLIPLDPQEWAGNELVFLHLGNTPPQKTLLPTIHLTPAASDAEITAAINSLKPYAKIVVGICATTTAPNKFGKAQQPSPAFNNILQQLHALNKPCIFVLWCTPYNLPLFAQEKTVLLAYEDEAASWTAAWNVLLGTFQAEGRLPINAETLSLKA